MIDVVVIEVIASAFDDMDNFYRLSWSRQAWETGSIDRVFEQWVWRTWS